MHQMTHPISSCSCTGTRSRRNESGMPEKARRILRLARFAFALIGLAALTPGLASSQVVQADIDFDASGYVTPAGMAPPSMYNGPVQPVGFFSGSPSGSCDAYGCDSYGGCGATGCDGIGGCDDCGGGSGGILGKLASGGCGCGSCFGGGGSGCGCLGGDCGLSNLRHLCMFCRGSGCSACQMVGNGQILSLIGALRPYSDAGICQQRWYDLSAEALFLTHDGGGSNFAVTSQGIAGPVVLSLADADIGGSTEAGVRLSGALIFGAGGNIESTYMGGHEWSSSASVSDDPGAGLFSFISDFGDLPTPGAGGYDDTDRSLLQSISSTSEFDSVELNYRRRTVGPYCRFQGSWLFGLRYVKYDEGLRYVTAGTLNNTSGANQLRFFSSDEDTENKMFGGQVGFDLWWNVVPGINLGIGAKGAWMKNDIDRRSFLTANSIGPNATPGTDTVLGGDETGTIMGEFEAKMVYRLTHSWSVRTAYYAMAIEDVAFSGVDVNSSRILADTTLNQQSFGRPVTFDSLVLQGFSVGAEYIW